MEFFYIGTKPGEEELNFFPTTITNLDISNKDTIKGKIKILKKFYGKIPPNIFLNLLIDIINLNLPISQVEEPSEEQKKHIEIIKKLIEETIGMKKINSLSKNQNNKSNDIKNIQNIISPNKNIEYKTRFNEKITSNLSEIFNYELDHNLIKILIKKTIPTLYKIKNIEIGTQIYGELYRSHFNIEILKKDLEGNLYLINMDTYGKGITIQQSIKSAMFELYERYFSLHREDNYKNNKIIELNKPESKNKYNNLGENENKHIGKFLKDEDGKYINIGYVFNSLYNPYKNDTSVFGSTTDGLSAGLSEEGTKYQGLMELIERYSLNNGEYKSININSIKNPNIKLFIDKFKPSIYKLSNNFGIPCYKALIRIQHEGKKFYLAGYGADLNSGIALTRAINELAVSINPTLNYNNIDSQNKNSEINFEPINYSTGDIKKDLYNIELYLKENNLKPTYINLSPNLDGLYVYRIIIAGLNNIYIDKNY